MYLRNKLHHVQSIKFYEFLLLIWKLCRCAMIDCFQKQVPFAGWYVPYGLIEDDEFWIHVTDTCVMNEWILLKKTSRHHLQ